MNGRRRWRQQGRAAGARRDSRERTALRRPMFRRRKVCRFCAEKIDDINYKDTKLLMSVRARTRQDRAAPYFGDLRDASAKAADRDHARAAARDASVHESNRLSRQSWKSFFENMWTTWASAARS